MSKLTVIQAIDIVSSTVESENCLPLLDNKQIRKEVFRRSYQITSGAGISHQQAKVIRQALNRIEQYNGGNQLTLPEIAGEYWH